MSANFDWQTEDDDRREHSGWDEPGAPPAPPRRRPPWRLLGLIGALLDALLHRLGLAAWPVGAAEYGQLARRPEQLRTMESLWRAETATAEERQAVYTLVDFLVARGDISIVDMQWRLARREDQTYWDWLQHATNGAYGTQADFESDLLRYATERGAEFAFAFH